jgi:hypothetical protein
MLDSPITQTMEGLMGYGGRLGRWCREKEERIQVSKPRERKSFENEGKLALVALNSPCSFLRFFPSP